MKQPDGSFTMHDGGEADIRGTYCALSVAALCGIMTDALRDGAAEWIIKYACVFSLFLTLPLCAV